MTTITKGFIDSNGLHSQIKKNDETLKKLYEDLGRSYYNATKDSPSEADVQRIRQIADIEEAQVNLRAQLQTGPENPGTAATVVCPKCGAVTEKAKFCKQCGAALE